VKGQGH